MKWSYRSSFANIRPIQLFSTVNFVPRTLLQPILSLIPPWLKHRNKHIDAGSALHTGSSVSLNTHSRSIKCMTDDVTSRSGLEEAPRLPQVPLVIVIFILLCVAEFAIPGGLTPRRIKEQILAKRVDEQLDLISPTDPLTVIPGGPLPIDDVHRQGLTHRGVWLFALDSHLRLLLAWRAPAVKTCPMTWAPLGEHTVTNETFELTAARGLSEEARFIARPRVFPVGAPFLYRAVYGNGTSEERTDIQWTQAYVVLPRGDALDFRTLDDREAEAEQAAGENSRYQGMSITEVVRHAVERPTYFCMSEISSWILRTIPLVIRVLKTNEKRLFRRHLRDDWAALVESGASVCCNSSEHTASLDIVNVSMCGVPCSSQTLDASDATI